MAIQTQLRGPGRVTAHRQEQRTEVGIVDVEVVVIDVDRLIARDTSQYAAKSRRISRQQLTHEPPITNPQ